jgi:putative ABC transport system permease protein
MTAAVRREVQAVDPNQPVFNVNMMEQVLADSLASQRLSMLLLSIFAGVALILAAVGIYGVMSYTVIQRTHEIGIRMALGARVVDVLQLILGHAMLLVLIGIMIGLVGAFAVTRVMASLLYGVSATDPLTFGGVSLLLAAIALVACLIPARRATRVDPMVALRHE